MKNGVVYWSEGTEHEMKYPGPLLGVRVRVYCDADTIVTVANDTQSSFAAEILPGNITEMNMTLAVNMTLAAAIITDANETHVADNTVAAETLPENITETNLTGTLPTEVDVQTMSEANYAVRGIAMPFITAAVGGMMILL